LKKFCIFVLSLVILVFSLAGCGEKRPAGADQAFYYPLSAEPVTLDPQICTDASGLTVIHAVFEGLVRLDQDGNPIPGIADRWDSNEDQTVFTFQLKEDAVWYGTGIEEDIPLTAEDFVFAFRRAVDPATNSPLASQLFCIQNAQEINSGSLPVESLGVTASGDHTLTVTLAYSCPEFPAMTASSVFMPCNESFFSTTNGKYGISNNFLLTNGPFRFSGYYAWEPYSHIELVRSPSYVGETQIWPASLYFYVGETEISLSDPVSLLLSQDLQAAPLTETQALEAENQQLQVLSYESAVCGLVFNTKDEYMKEESIRKAFVGTIDRDFLLEKLPAHTTAASDIISLEMSYRKQSYRDAAGTGLYFRENPETVSAARETLKNMGQEAFPSVSILCEDREDIKLLVNQIIICWNNAMGNYFNIEPVSSEELSSRVLSGDYQIALYSLSPDGDTPTDLLQLFTSESSENPAGLADPVYDAYISAAFQSDGLSACLAAEKFLNDTCIFYPIYYTDSYYGLATGVSGLYADSYSSWIDFSGGLIRSAE
jgi:oligopeptide transport system substrate-binding protein